MRAQTASTSASVVRISQCPARGDGWLLRLSRFGFDPVDGADPRGLRLGVVGHARLLHPVDQVEVRLIAGGHQPFTTGSPLSEDDASGKQKPKVLPLPYSLWKWTVPPCRSMIFLTRYKPKPVPSMV